MSSAEQTRARRELVRGLLATMPDDVAAAMRHRLGADLAYSTHRLVYDTAERDVAALPALAITQDAFAALPEYSRSTPSCVTPGKRWRCDVHAGLVTIVGCHGLWFLLPLAPLWVIGGYEPMSAEGYVSTTWWRPETRG